MSRHARKVVDPSAPLDRIVNKDWWDEPEGTVVMDQAQKFFGRVKHKEGGTLLVPIFPVPGLSHLTKMLHRRFGSFVEADGGPW